MSHNLYSTCLHWSGRHGFAKMHGVLVALKEGPSLAGVAVAMIHYVPEVGMRTVTFHGSGQRDMRDEEVAAADALLIALTR